MLRCAMAVVLVMTCVTLAACNGSRETAYQMVGKTGSKGFMIRSLATTGRKYGLFVPLNYDPNQAYPMIVFLHGVGEGGSDVSGPLHVGLAPFVADRAHSFPFICVFPQSTGDWNENSAAANDAIEAIAEVEKLYNVDSDRISLTGLSTGGYGTWAIGAKYKHLFAALVPMGSSASDSKDASRLVDMPVWSFHNSGDMFAAPWNDSMMVDKIKTLGGHAEYTEYGAAGHDCWETAYSDGALFSWLQRQRRRTSMMGSSGAPHTAGAQVTQRSGANTPLTSY